MKSKSTKAGTRTLLLAIAFATGIAFLPTSERRPESPNDSALSQKTRGAPQLVSVEDLGGSDGEVCIPEPLINVSQLGTVRDAILGRLGPTSVFAAVKPGYAFAAQVPLTRPPVRTVMDTDPIYVSVAVNNETDEVVLADTNLVSIRVFDRTTDTPPDRIAEERRVIAGPHTMLQLHQGLYVDPETGDISTVGSDKTTLLTFAAAAEGDAPPIRVFNRPSHRGFAIAVDEERGEMYTTTQHPPEINVHRKDISEVEYEETPLRVIKGDRTMLADVRGIALDVDRELIFVSNYGNYSDTLVAGTGQMRPPSITVYPLDANGNAAPVRVIQGPNTQLNWPAAVSVDPETGDLYVANDMGHSVLVFKSTDDGNVQPARVIAGHNTGLSYPIGVYVDAQNRELWVANMGNSSATAFALTADGDVAPLRTIRSAPEGKQSLRWGKPSGLAYDSVREQLLVAN